MCSKHFRYTLKGKAGSNRPIPITSAKSLPTKFYQVKCGHVCTGVYLKWFGHRADDKCRWRGGTVAQTWEYLLRHYCWWKYQQCELCREVGKGRHWKAGRCRQADVSELLSMDKCDKAVIDILAAMDIRKFPPK